MEENPKPRSRAFLVACLLLGALAGVVGAVLGTAMTTSRGIFDLPERVVMNALFGGPVFGAGVGYTVWRLQPSRDAWEGCLGWAVLLAGNLLGSAISAGLVFYLIARITRR
jgi:H+/Cl- antiporter ClcA